MLFPRLNGVELNPASICAECYAHLLLRVRAQPEPLDAQWCPHRDTVAIVQCVEGHIVRWTLQGPVTEAQSAELVQHAVESLRERYLRASADAAAGSGLN